MATGDVGADGDGNEKAETVGDGGGDKAGGGCGSIAGEFVVGDAGTRPGEDEDEGTDELSDGGFQGAGLAELIGVADGDVAEGDVEVFGRGRHGLENEEREKGGLGWLRVMRVHAIVPLYGKLLHASGGHRWIR